MSTGRVQSPGEEIANSAIHGAALVASIAALPTLVFSLSRSGDAWRIASGAVFGVTLIVLYLSSTLYHAWQPGPMKHRLRVLDHSAIYLLIAGSYTPFMVGPLRGAWGWTLLAIIWAMALIGIVAKCTLGFRLPHLSTIMYVAMGWLAIVALRPLIASVSPAGLAWLIGGGVCYTAGVAFYVTDARLKYGHAIWHVFVAGGSVCHFFAILWHAAPKGA